MPRTLLLADDSVTTQRVVELTFSGEDVRVVAVHDGEQALACIAAEKPDIVLADIAIPKRSGYDVSSFVKDQPLLRHIPVLLLAGAFEPVDRARAEQARCDGIVVKPFEPRHLATRVHELLLGSGTREVRGHSVDAAIAPVERPVEALGLRAGGAPAPAVAAEPPASAAASDAELFFSRFDAAMATHERRVADVVPTGDDDLEVPTLDRLLSDALEETRSEGPTFQMEVGTASGAVRLSDAFAALLAIEQGEPCARPVRLTAQPSPEITADFVEAVVAKVIERLAPTAVKEVVADVVSDVAERLVREEIARIRAG